MYNANQFVLITLWTCVNAKRCACSVCVSGTTLDVLLTMWGVSHNGPVTLWRFRERMPTYDFFRQNADIRQIS